MKEERRGEQKEGGGEGRERYTELEGRSISASKFFP
jgi:hypothetical protein